MARRMEQRVRSPRDLAAHHLTEAIRHLSTAVAFLHQLTDGEKTADVLKPLAEADVLAHLAQVVYGSVETMRDVRDKILPASTAIRGRVPKKPDRRAVERRADKRRLDDKRKAVLRGNAKRRTTGRAKP